MAVKPGYKTSEFWFTFVSFIFSGLFLLGVIGENDQKEELISNVSHAVESCILIGGQLMILFKYMKSRSTVKQAYWNSQSPVAPTPIPDPTPTPAREVEEVKNDRIAKPKSNKSGNRKTNSKSKRRPNGNKKSSNK